MPFYCGPYAGDNSWMIPPSLDHKVSPLPIKSQLLLALNDLTLLPPFWLKVRNASFASPLVASWLGTRYALHAFVQASTTIYAYTWPARLANGMGPIRSIESLSKGVRPFGSDLCGLPLNFAFGHTSNPIPNFFVRRTSLKAYTLGSASLACHFSTAVSETMVPSLWEFALILTCPFSKVQPFASNIARAIELTIANTENKVYFKPGMYIASIISNFKLKFDKYSSRWPFACEVPFASYTFFIHQRDRLIEPMSISSHLLWCNVVYDPTSNDGM